MRMIFKKAAVAFAGVALLVILAGGVQAKPKPAAPAVAAQGPLTPRFPPGTRILFQGDFITDGGRGRKDFALKLARCVVMSNDMVALEDLKVRNLVRNRHLAKPSHDAAWSKFGNWLL